MLEFFNFIGQQFEDLGQTIVDSLPASPIIWLEANPQVRTYLGYVNWFIPIYQMIPILELWLVAILCYYVIQVILRWVKVVE